MKSLLHQIMRIGILSLTLPATINVSAGGYSWWNRQGTGDNNMYPLNVSYFDGNLSPNAAPDLSKVSAGFVNNTSARIYATGNMAGKIYWALCTGNSVITTAAAVKVGTGAAQSGSINYTSINKGDFITLGNLTKATGYTLYLVLEANNVLSSLYSVQFTTANITKDFSAQIAAAQGVLSRLIPGNASKFVFAGIENVGDNLDVFELSSSGGQILVKGSSGVAMTSGVNWYLKNYCKVSFSWNGDQTNFPSSLPTISGTIRKVSPYKYRYMFNYCTFNYTMAFWQWREWQREIDLMAMDGVNLSLAIVGQEALWQNFLKKFGYSSSEIFSFIPGPAYQAWWLMDNLQGHGGPVSQAYVDSRMALQKNILSRFDSLGIEPVLQGFYGMVPTNFSTKVPGATTVAQGAWSGLTRPPMLHGVLLDSAANVWYRESEKLFGKRKFFGGDPFHEGGNTTGIDVTKTATQIQAAMLKHNPEATWVLQAWQSNPQQALLDGIKKDQALILDYSNDVYGFWKPRGAFGGVPWIYGVINNFGGRMGMYARLPKISAGVKEMLNSPNKLNNWGIGIAPEAIIYNQISYDEIWDMVWDGTISNLDSWTARFSDNRYGKTLDNTDRYWNILQNSALNCTKGQEGGTESIINARPSLNATNASCCSTTNPYFTLATIVPAWTHLYNSIDVFKKSKTFQHDLVDMSRQILSNYEKTLYDEMVSAINANNNALFKTKSADFLKLMDDQDSLLRCREEFLLGKWIADAKSAASTPAEATLFEKNARYLLTLWVFSNDALHDYAHHEWAGLTKNYYKERWKLFVAYYTTKLSGGSPGAVNYYNWEKNWCETMPGTFNSAPQGDPIALASYIYTKYMPKVIAVSVNRSPVITSTGFTIAESSANGTVVGKLSFTDPDAADTHVFSIYEQSVSGAFSINSATGEISVLNSSALNAQTTPIITVLFKVTDNGVPSYSPYKEIPIKVTPFTTVKEYEANKDFSVFPNPTKEIINIKYDISAANGEGIATLYDLSGKVMKEIILPKNAKSITIPVMDIPMGMYFISIKANGYHLTPQKIVLID